MPRASLAALLMPLVLVAACSHVKSGGIDYDAWDEGDGGVVGGEGNDLAGHLSTDLAVAPTWAGVVYAHSPDTLYKVDPDTLKTTKIAPFTWPNGSDQMTDIAVDKDGNMVGISFASIYSVDPMTARCKYLAAFPGSQVNGLSFVPAPGVDPQGGDEILVAADLNGDLWRVDPKTGKTTKIGNYGSGMTSSGDIVGVEGAAYATVKQGLGANDQLVKVDPTTGKATLIGDTGFQDLWGLGYWKQKVFGFSQAGEFVLIDVNTGKGKLQQMSSFEWWGAGVTTIAPTTIQ